jgi:hypothetical protein
MAPSGKFFLVPISTVVEQPALERWIIRHEGGYSHNWRFLYDTSCAVLLGRVFGCGRAPEIYSLRAGTWNDDFVRRDTDTEVADLVHIMRTGTAAEKEQAVRSAVDQALGRQNVAPDHH